MNWWKQNYIIVKIFMKYMYLKLLQNMYITVSHLYKNTYEVQYILHDKIYKIRTHVKRGPSKIIQILDHLDDDVTEDVRSYLGPNEDFHGQFICPHDIGYENLYIFLRNGDTLSFKENDVIRIP